MSVKYQISDEVVLITGAAQGLGAATADSFLREGAKHVAIVDINEEGAVTAAKLNDKYGAGKSSFMKCDVADEEKLFACFDRVTKEQGNLNTIINNAGILNDSKDVYKKMIEINYTVPVGSTLKAIDMWRADEGGNGGTVINISSEVVIRLDPQCPIYGSTKAAILHFTQCIGNEMHYKQTKVRVMSMCPGISRTQLFGDFKTRRVANYENSDMMDIDVAAMGQSPAAVADGIVEMFKKAESGDTWLVSNETTQDVTREANHRFFLGNF